MGKICRVVVNGIRGEKVTIDLCNTEEQMKSMTVRQLKEKVIQELPGTAIENLRLVFADKALEGDSDLLCQYGIQHESVIHVVVKVAGGGGDPAMLVGGMGDKEGKNRSMERLATM